jgi:tetratricopeptide (TPR) repeat protein
MKKIRTINQIIIKTTLLLTIILTLNSCYNTKKAEASFNQGMIFFDLENYQEAIIDFDNAIKEYPKYEQAYVQRGLSKQKINMHREAIMDFEKAIELNPKNTDYIYFKSYSKGVLLGSSLVKKEREILNNKIDSIK